MGPWLVLRLVILPLVNNILGVIPLGELHDDNYPRAHIGRVTIQLHVGLDGAGAHVPANHKPLNNAGGDVPDIRIWNSVGDYIGRLIDPGRANSGMEREFVINMPVAAGSRLAPGHRMPPGVGLAPGAQPAYLMLTGNDDAVCLAQITMAWPDKQGFVWTGNWAEVCGESWYYSNIYLHGHPLKCAWLDRDGHKPTTAISIYLPDFFAKPGDKKPSSKPFCSKTPTMMFRKDHDPRDFEVWPQGSRIDRRNIVDADYPEDYNATETLNATTSAKGNTQRVKRSQPVHRMVKSTLVEHSARALCESSSSMGPDLVSIEEGTFCDMDSRQVYDLCANEDSVDCFDLETRRVRASEAGIMKRGEPVHKDYSQIMEW